MQRLFSTFADGWPGVGLLLQRILTAILLLRFGVIQPIGASFTLSMIPQLVGSLAGILLFAGLWTPIVGTLICVVELWSTITNASDSWTSITIATLGVTAAMIGPGAWSLDARLFGRKHLET